MASFDTGGRLPPEIWNEIFNLACVEDGSTSVSLSKVSRSFRVLSEDQRYLSVKIRSTPQLLKFEETLASKGKLEQCGLKTRFLCIILPESVMDQAYPDQSFSADKDAEDQSQRSCSPSWESAESDPESESDISMDSSDDSSSDGFDSDDAELEYKPITFGELGELYAELHDLQRDILPVMNIMAIGDLADLQNLNTASGFLECKIFSAIRRILDACSETLEAFTIWFHPIRLVPFDFLVPRLPKLVYLSIGVHDYFNCKPMGRSAKAEQPPANPFPSLLRLRLFTKDMRGSTGTWWKNIIELATPTTGRRKKVEVITSMSRKQVYASHLPDDKKVEICWQWLDPDDYPTSALRELLATWWAEDMAGGKSYSTPGTPPRRIGNLPRLF
ncbi:hypothetical protein NMY22_g9763 [Coprinellus aureogranulatus]|nr:hypothetical protein NMY22_g9763 [Coprinellus aureogranulatus]